MEVWTVYDNNRKPSVKTIVLLASVIIIIALFITGYRARRFGRYMND